MNKYSEGDSCREPSRHIGHNSMQKCNKATLEKGLFNVLTVKKTSHWIKKKKGGVEIQKLEHLSI